MLPHPFPTHLPARQSKKNNVSNFHLKQYTVVKEINFFKNIEIIFIKENVLPSSLTLSHGVTQMMRFIHGFSYYSLQHKSFYLWHAAPISAFSRPKFSVCAGIEALDKNPSISLLAKLKMKPSTYHWYLRNTPPCFPLLLSHTVLPYQIQ